jgi:hypothetical protein
MKDFVLDAEAGWVGIDDGDRVLVAVVEDYKVGVRSFQTAVSVLCHRTKYCMRLCLRQGRRLFQKKSCFLQEL